MTLRLVENASIIRAPMDDPWFAGCLSTCGEEMFREDLDVRRGVRIDTLDVTLGQGLTREQLRRLHRVGLLTNKERLLLSGILFASQTAGSIVSKLFPLVRPIEISLRSEAFFVFEGKRIVKVLDFTDGSILNLPISPEGTPYLNTEIHMRQEVNGIVSTPPIIRSSLSDSECPYFMEPQIWGKPFATYSELEHPELLQDVFDDLFAWYESQPVETVSSTTYVGPLIDDIESRAIFQEAGERPRVLLDRIQASLPDVSLMKVRCHGDFHRKNLIVDGDSYYLIDWELSDHSSLFYDFFTFGFNAALFDSDIGFLESEIYQGELIESVESIVSAERLAEYGLVFMVEKLHLLTHDYGDESKAKQRVEDWSDIFHREFDQLLAAS